MAENIVVMTLPTHSGTYEAFSKLKSAAGFDLNAARHHRARTPTA